MGLGRNVAALCTALLALCCARQAHAEEEAQQKRQHVAVIGAGYAGLAAACELSQQGFQVTVYEANDFVGGRAHTYTTPEGFTFDAGPSWYWMPEVFERFFARYGRTPDEYYTLSRLDPAYRIVLPRGDEPVDVPGTWEGFLEWAHLRDPERAAALDVMFEEARRKYEKGIFEWIWKPMLNVAELADVALMRAGIEYDMFGGFEAHLRKYVRDPLLLTTLKWPVIFLGASPAQAPALYSLMTFAGHALGTWYPSGGMDSPARAMGKLAGELGAKFNLGAAVSAIRFDGVDTRRATAVCVSEPGGAERCDAVDGIVAAADYHFVEQTLLPIELRRYGPEYWDSQVLSPSCLLFYLGLNRPVRGLRHHTFFFDVDLDEHLRAAFIDHVPAEQPTFYVSATSKTDRSVTPDGAGEALFILVPISYKLNGTDTAPVRRAVLDLVLRRMERSLAVSDLRKAIVYERHYGPGDFERDFHAFRGNAFGHANLLSQSLVLKPSMDSLATNLVFAGHLTNPGPGVPPAIVSGTVAAQLLQSKMAAEEPSSWFTWGAAARLALFAHGLIALWILLSERRKSYALCVKLLFENGRTYFAAATLMNQQRFLDTAAMYGLFRIADDLVDNEDSPMERHANLEKFIASFWQCWRRGEGDYTLHPALPAIIETSRRHAYPRDLFERFFRSMRMDVGNKTCATLGDTMDYMEGSAAVIGEFMLPVLMPRATEDEMQAAMGHARDLGLAFQLTNMIRDVDEDLDLGRQYVPTETCARHGVDLGLRDASQSGFADLMEEMFRHADAFYASADIGIELLPADVRDVIRVARIAYHRIHDKIRAAKYDIFASRASVPFREKLFILLATVPKLKLARILVVEAYARVLHALTRAPVLLLLFGLLATSSLAAPRVLGCTYAQFHLLFVLGPLASLLLLARVQVLDRTPQQEAHARHAAAWTALLCLVATLYTTPWDNYLVASGVWGYPPERVAATIGYVPVEEYAFFTLETLLTGALWLTCFPNAQTLHLSTHKVPPAAAAVRAVGIAVGLGTWASGVLMVSAGGNTLYLGLILVWAFPVLVFQWWFGSGVLIVHRSPLVACIAASAAYLCLADQWAIRHGIWHISSAFTLPQVVFPDLPIEEATFFLVTACMCSFGLTLAMVVSKHHASRSGSLADSLRTVHRFGLAHAARVDAPRPAPTITRVRPRDPMRQAVAASCAVLGLAAASLSLLLPRHTMRQACRAAPLVALLVGAVVFVLEGASSSIRKAAWACGACVSAVAHAVLGVATAQPVTLAVVAVLCGLDTFGVEPAGRSRFALVAKKSALAVPLALHPGALATFMGGVASPWVTFEVLRLCTATFWVHVVSLALLALGRLLGRTNPGLDAVDFFQIAAADAMACLLHPSLSFSAFLVLFHVVEGTLGRALARRGGSPQGAVVPASNSSAHRKSSLEQLRIALLKPSLDKQV